MSDECLLIYVDGLAFHSSLRQRMHDTSQTNRLQGMGYRVLRFLGSQVTHASGTCIAQIQSAMRTDG
jgi:very-short-patch-repair endonuclease